jgi:hypothetical protein
MMSNSLSGINGIVARLLWGVLPVLLAFPVVAQDVQGVMSLEEVRKLTNSEKIDMSKKLMSEMKSELSKVLGILANANKEKDVMKINAVNRSLQSIKGLLRIAEQAEMAMQEAIASGEQDTAAHEFHKIFIAHMKIQELSLEAEQSVGQAAFDVGSTTVEVQIDKEMVPANDPSAARLPQTPVTRPPETSRSR